MLSVAESGDAFDALERAGIHVDEIVVNRVLPPRRPCPLCDRRRAEEAEALAVIRRRLGRRRAVRVIPADVKEPRGVDALAAIGRELVTDGSKRRADTSRLTARRQAASSPSLSERHTVAPEVAAGVPRRLAALLRRKRRRRQDDCRRRDGAAAGARRAGAARAAAVDRSRAFAGRCVRRAGRATKRRRSGAAENLRCASSTRRARWRRSAATSRRRWTRSRPHSARARQAAARIAAARADGPGAARHRRAVRHRLRCRRARRLSTLIVVDTAPTGHALRLLEMPDAAREWVQALLRVLLKYRALVRPGQLAPGARRRSRSRSASCRRCCATRRTRGSSWSRARPRSRGSRRSGCCKRLRQLQLSTPAVVVNAMTRRTRGRASAVARSLQPSADR